MLKRVILRRLNGGKFTRGAFSLTVLFLLIEFFDELHYGVQGAVLPVLRADLALSYAQIGLLLGLPKVINTFIEPVIMLFGDTELRKRLVISGGLVIIIALLLTGTAWSFVPLLVAFVVSYPASGAFVTLSQATLMDLNPGREAQMMARWTVAGSLGNLLGPLIVAAGFALALGWRWVFFFLAGLALLLTLLLLPVRFPTLKMPDGEDAQPEDSSIRVVVREAWRALRNQRLLRWLGLLELSDLLLDVFTGYVALYFADVVGLMPVQVGVLLSVLMFAGLLSDLLLIPLLERVPGRWVVRVSAAFVALVYTAWLLAPWLWAKLLLVVVIRFSTVGWYQVLQGEAYATLPGRSGTVMAINSLAGIVGGVLAWSIGYLAAQAGLPFAMWMLLLGPISLALFVPRPGQ